MEPLIVVVVIGSLVLSVPKSGQMHDPEAKAYDLTTKLLGEVEGMSLVLLCYSGLLVSSLFLIQPGFDRNMVSLFWQFYSTPSDWIESPIRSAYVALPTISISFFGFYSIVYWKEEAKRLLALWQRECGGAISVRDPPIAMPLSALPGLIVLIVGVQAGLSLPSPDDGFLYAFYQMHPVNLLSWIGIWCICLIFPVHAAIYRIAPLRSVFQNTLPPLDTNISRTEPRTAISFLLLQLVVFTALRIFYVDLPYSGWPLYPYAGLLFFFVPTLVVLRSIISNWIEGRPISTSVFLVFLFMAVIWIEGFLGPSLALPLCLALLCYYLGSSIRLIELETAFPLIINHR